MALLLLLLLLQESGNIVAMVQLRDLIGVFLKKNLSRQICRAAAGKTTTQPPKHSIKTGREREKEGSDAVTTGRDPERGAAKGEGAGAVRGSSPTHGLVMGIGLATVMDSLRSQSVSGHGHKLITFTDWSLLPTAQIRGGIFVTVYFL